MRAAESERMAGSSCDSVPGALPDFRALFEAVPGAYLVLLPDAPRYTIVAVCEAYLRATMTTREGILWRGLFEVFPDNPDDPSATGTQNLRASLERAVATRQPDTMAVQHYDIRRPDGQWEERYWSPVNTPVIGVDGHGEPVVTHLIHRVEDVTEVVQLGARERERAHAAQQWHQRALEMQTELVARAQELQEANVRLRAANARVTEMLRERERVLEMEREARASLETADRAKTAFFSNVSHEFRTPLTLILGPIEDARATGDDGLRGDALDVVYRNALRLLKLVNTLLDVVRLEAGRADATYELTDIAALTAELASAFRAAIERAGLAFKVDCQELPERVYVDRDMWEKIVLNLLSNALKHTFEGEIKVTIRSAGARAELTVRDTGVGIPADQISQLFERFHRVTRTRSRTLEGTGIGLALVKELVKLHGGTITVQSAEGDGTTFAVRVPYGSTHLPPERVLGPGRRTVSMTPATSGVHAFVEEALRWLPADGASESRPAPEPARVERDTAPSRAAGPAPVPRILLADDNADMRDYLAHLMRGRGWAVEARSDGHAALEAALRHVPDLVLSDVMMPGLDGFALLRALRADERTRLVPVVLLTARAEEQSRITGFEAGVDDYLVKPFSARELLARVAAMLELARMRREAIDSERRLRAAEAENAAKARFLTTMSHELRTPLNAIAGYVDLLQLGIHGPLTPEQEHALARVQWSQRRLLSLITDILNYSRIEAGQVEHRLEDVPLPPVLAEVGAVIETQARTRSVDYRCTCPADIIVRADRDRLEQILLNLLSNAVKFTEPGGRVELDCETAEATVRIHVADTGRGIPAEHLATIFSPFVQLDRQLTPQRDQGLGLGLSISRDLARQLGGDITVQSEVGRGSTFTLIVPHATAPVPAQAMGRRRHAAADGD